MGALEGVADKEMSGMQGEREVHDRINWPSGADLRSLEKLLEEVGLAPGYGRMDFAHIPGKGYLWVSEEEAANHSEIQPKLD